MIRHAQEHMTDLMDHTDRLLAGAQAPEGRTDDHRGSVARARGKHVARGAASRGASRDREVRRSGAPKVDGPLKERTDPLHSPGQKLHLRRLGFYKRSMQTTTKSVPKAGTDTRG